MTASLLTNLKQHTEAGHAAAKAGDFEKAVALYKLADADATAYADEADDIHLGDVCQVVGVQMLLGRALAEWKLAEDKNAVSLARLIHDCCKEAWSIDDSSSLDGELLALACEVLDESPDHPVIRQFLQPKKGA